MLVKIAKNLTRLRPSETLIINQKSKSLELAGKEIYKFGFGQSPFPIPAIMEEALRENAFQKDYLPVNGLESLRDSVANHTNYLLGSQYTKDNVFIGPGSKELIFLTQLALEVPLLIPTPSWVSYAPQAQIVNKSVHWIPPSEGQWNISGKDLGIYLQKHHLTNGLLILNYPCNPTGAHMDDNTLSEIAEVASRHNIIIISDEIYGLLSFDGHYRSISKFYPEGTIISSGLSKWCGAGGWRLGTFVIPNELVELYQMLQTLASETFSAVSAPIQFAAVSAYRQDDSLTKYRQSCIQILFKISEFCTAYMRKHNIIVHEAEGGFYLFPNFKYYRDKLYSRGITTSQELCERVLDEVGVALLPGSVFGMDKSELVCRFCFVDFDGKQALDFVNKYGNIQTNNLNILFPKMIKGTEKLCEWLNFD